MSSSYVGESTPIQRIMWRKLAREALNEPGLLPSHRAWVERTLLLIQDIEDIEDLADVDGDE